MVTMKKTYITPGITFEGVCPRAALMAVSLVEGLGTQDIEISLTDTFGDEFAVKPLWEMLL